MTVPHVERLQREQAFHDVWAKDINIDELLVRESFESPTAIENQYILGKMGSLRGKHILDLGCGAGESAVFFALYGARVSACDISPGFIEVGKRLAKKYQVSVDFQQADTGKLPYADETFDFVYGNGILHHVDIQQTIPEVHRVLKKGAQAHFIEPLPYNAVIEIYRHLAKGVRTEDEKPVRFHQLKAFRTQFAKYEHQEFWFSCLLIFFHFFLVRRWHPSKVRYWKKVIEEGPRYQRSFGRLKRFDDMLLGALPFLRIFCWNTVVTVTK